MGKTCTVRIDKSTIVSLRQLENPTAGKDGGSGEGGVLATQQRTTDTDAAKVDTNAKSDATHASDTSKIDTPNIDVKTGIGKQCAVVIALSWNVCLIHQPPCDTQSDDEGADTGKPETKKKAKKEATKADARQKSDCDLEI